MKLLNERPEITCLLTMFLGTVLGLVFGYYLFASPVPLKECHPAVLMLEPDSQEPLFISGLEVCSAGFTLNDPQNRNAPGFPPLNGEGTLLEVK